MFFSKRLNKLAIFVEKKDTLNLFQRWVWDGIASPKDFVPVPRVPGICVPWDDFGTARILGTAWDSSPRDSPGILEFFYKNMIYSSHFSDMNPYNYIIILLCIVIFWLYHFDLHVNSCVLFSEKKEWVREGFKKKKRYKLGTLSQVRLPPPPSELGTSLS